MKFVESLNKNDTTVGKTEESYNKSGSLLNNEKEKTFAKFTETKLKQGDYQKKYYITVHNNAPYDPYGIDSHREDKIRTNLKTVSKQTFEYYILYLKTRNLLYMTRTNRSFING